MFPRRVLLRCWPNKTRKPNRHEGSKRFWGDRLRKLSAILISSNLSHFDQLSLNVVLVIEMR